MAFWFEKGELRRFNRVTLPAKVFVTPAKPIRDKQILALGIDYFPPSVQKKIAADEEKTHYWFDHIQEQQTVLKPVFEELMQAVTIFGEQVKAISYGKTPKADPQAWQAFCQKAKGAPSVAGLKESAPKTYEYLHAMNLQLKTHYVHLAKCLDASTPTQFNLGPSLPSDFKIDEMMARFQAPIYAKIPLVQALLFLHQFMQHHFAAYVEMIKDHQLRQNLNRLDEQAVNLSAGGVSMLLNKRFAPNTRCDVYFLFEESNRFLSVRSTLVRAELDKGFHQECNAFNFDFPEGSDQMLIQQEIERFEILNSLEVSL